MSDDQHNKIEDTLSKVASGVSNLSEDIKDIKHDITGNKENIENVLSNQDWMIGTLSRLDTERLAVVKTLREHGDKINQLEQRVKQLQPVSN